MKTINFQNALVSASGFVNKAKTVLKTVLFKATLVYLLFATFSPTADLSLDYLRDFLLPLDFSFSNFWNNIVHFSLYSEITGIEEMLSIFSIAILMLAGKNFYCVITSLFLKLTEFVGYKNKYYFHQRETKYKESNFKGIQFDTGELLGEVVTFSIAFIAYGYCAGGLTHLLNGVIFLKACYFGTYIILTNEVWVKSFFKGIGMDIPSKH